MTKIERILLTRTPLGFLLRKTKKIHLPGFEGVPLYDVMEFFRKQVKTHGFTERASAIAYNFIMALPPSLLFLFTLIPNLPFISKKSIKLQLHGLIFDIIPSKIYNKDLIKFVDSFIDGNKIGLISFGLFLSLFFASNAMMGIMRSFNKNYFILEKRKRLHQRWIAIRLTIIIFSLVLGYLILLISQGALLRLLVQNDSWRRIINTTRWALIIVVIYVAIGFIYRHAPAVQKRWKFSSPGTILATTLSILATLGFSIFVSDFGRYNALYGSIGTVMVLMALIYINSLVLLIGFELNVSIKSLKAIAAKREADEKLKSG